MSLLTLTGITIRIAGRTLLDNADLAVDPGRRIGLVGRNGAGKSTLLKAIAGDLAVDGGDIRLAARARMGRVKQEAPSGPQNLLETVLQADTERVALLAEAEHEHADPHRLGEVHDRLIAIGADAAPARTALLGWQRSNDPALDVLADGWAVAMTEIAPRVWQGILPRGTGNICLRSRCFVPADIDPSAEDRRVLGIAVTALRLNSQPLRCLPGWHDPEPGWRWTTGEAYCTAGAGVLEITAAAAAPWYWVAPDARGTAVRSGAWG